MLNRAEKNDASIAEHPSPRTCGRVEADPDRPPLATYSAQVAWLIFFVILLLVLCVPVGLFLFAAFSGLSGFVPASAEQWAGWTLTLLLFGTYPVVLGYYMLSYGAQYCGFRLSIFPEGVEREGWLGSSFWKWEEIESVRYRLRLVGRPTNRTSRPAENRRLQVVQVAIRFGNGAKIVLTKFYDTLVDLCRRIDEEFCRRRLPEELERLARGDVLNFGPIRVSNQGLKTEVDAVPWKKMSGLDVTPYGRLVAAVDGLRKPIFRIPAWKIDNLPLLFVLVEEMRWRAENGSDSRGSKATDTKISSCAPGRTEPPTLLAAADRDGNPNPARGPKE
jgi:hypothetical protein